MNPKQFWWVLVVVALVSCSRAPDGVIESESYAQGCTRNDECIKVDVCLCDCQGGPCGSYGVVHESDLDRFRADRSAARQRCLEPEEQPADSCIVPTAACVDGACRLVDDLLPPSGPDAPGPNEWDRACEEDFQCTVVPVSDCTLCGCEREHVAVNGDSAQDARLWTASCDSYRDDCPECDYDGPRTDLEARCVDGRCEAVHPGPADFDHCAALDGNETCREAGCQRFNTYGHRLVDGECERESVSFCTDYQGGIEITDITPYYYREGIIVQLPASWGGWTPCEGSSAPECDCRP